MFLPFHMILLINSNNNFLFDLFLLRHYFLNDRLFICINNLLDFFLTFSLFFLLYILFYFYTFYSIIFFNRNLFHHSSLLLLLLFLLLPLPLLLFLSNHIN